MAKTTAPSPGLWSLQRVEKLLGVPLGVILLEATGATAKDRNPALEPLYESARKFMAAAGAAIDPDAIYPPATTTYIW
jgi:hypothetical protein